MKKGPLRVMLWVVIGLMALVAGIITSSALSNLNLPARSKVFDRLSVLEKARLAESIHLRKTLGNAVWPGWGEVDVPIIVYNEEYAFIVAYPDPPAGWLKMPQKEPRGGVWEAVPNDTFDQPLPAVAADPAFKKYATREHFWRQQIGQAKQGMGLEGETHFYYSGLTQAALLDRVLPDWKQRAFDPNVMLEDLLKEAVQPSQTNGSD